MQNLICIIVYVIILASCGINKFQQNMKTYTDRDEKTYSYVGKKLVSVKGSLGEYLGTYKTNKEDFEITDGLKNKFHLVKRGKEGVVFVGDLGLKGGFGDDDDDNDREYLEKELTYTIKDVLFFRINFVEILNKKKIRASYTLTWRVSTKNDSMFLKRPFKKRPEISIYFMNENNHSICSESLLLDFLPLEQPSGTFVTSISEYNDYSVKDIDHISVSCYPVDR